MIFPTTLKSRLILVFGSLMVIVMSLASITVFEKMKSLIVEKYLESAHRVTQMGTIPLIDAMLAAETENPLPADYYERSLRTLMKQSKQEILYAYFLNEDGESLLPPTLKNINKLNPDYFEMGNSIFQQKDGWILQTMDRVGISTKVWGYLVLGFNAVQIQQEVKQALYLIYVASGIVILIILFATNLIAETMTRRLNQLSLAVDHFTFYPGDEGLPEGQDEIGRLATNFNDLRQRLIQSRQDLKNSERNVFQAEKLAAIGRLAAGVAHEINNPLMGIRHTINNITNSNEDKIEQEKELILIDEALNKIESVISKLLGFSRRKSDNSTDASLNEAIRTVTKLLDYAIQATNINLVLELDSSLPSIHCNPHLLDEITMNLIINAIDASHNGDTLACKTWHSNEKIILEIIDAGHGIPASDINRIFEPFFTTKEVGKGTGLGLYVTREIVQGLGGEITLSSQLNKGTKFTVTLPGNSL